MLKIIKILSLFIYCILQFVNLNSKISLLTKPIGNGTQDLHDSGHYGVTRSIYDGLKKLGVDFNYNPKTIDEVGEHVFVLSDFQALKQAINLKQQSKVKIILVGPNAAGSPLQENGIIMANEVDTILVPSEWVANSQKEVDVRLKEKIKIWPAGVDEIYWNPINKNYNSKTVLIYWKNVDQNFVNTIQTILKNNNWAVEIIKYGNYDQSQFKNALSRARFAVFLSKTESQGLALAESWAMDVPTLVWNKSDNHTYLGITYNNTSSAPYLTNKTGLFWKNIDEFTNLISNIETEFSKFSPRKWILANMTDTKCAKKIVELFNQNKTKL